jgi:hypothetical protein
MDTSQILFLTKEQVAKKGNGIIFTDAQLSWFKKLIFGDPSEQIVPKETVQQTIKEEENPAIREQQKIKEYKAKNTTYTFGIKRETLARLRSYCYHNNIKLASLIEKILEDSKILEGYTSTDIGAGFKKDHNNDKTPPSYKYKKTYDEMHASGYITRAEAAIILGVNRSSLTDYIKNGLKHIKKGKFAFFKPEDIEKYKLKLLKKKIK